MEPAESLSDHGGGRTTISGLIGGQLQINPDASRRHRICL